MWSICKYPFPHVTRFDLWWSLISSVLTNIDSLLLNTVRNIKFIWILGLIQWYVLLLSKWSDICLCYSIDMIPLVCEQAKKWIWISLDPMKVRPTIGVVFLLDLPNALFIFFASFRSGFDLANFGTGQEKLRAGHLLVQQVCLWKLLVILVARIFSWFSLGWVRVDWWKRFIPTLMPGLILDMMTMYNIFQV